MHHIHRHSIQINSSNQQLGQEINAQISALIKQDFYPRLEKLLDEYSYADKTVRIPKMNINLKEITPQNWKKEVVNQSLNEIEKHLKSIFYSLRHTKTSKEKFLYSNDKLQFGTEENPIKNISVVSVREELSAVLLHYLQTGFLKPNTIVLSLTELWEKISITDELLQEISKLFYANIEPLKRWLYNVPDSFKNRVLNFLSLSFENNQSIAQVFYWNLIFDKINDGQNLDNKELQKTTKEIISKFANQSVEDMFSTDAEFKKMLEIDFNINKNADVEQKKEMKETVDKFYIENAGLILFHPFLQEFFQKNSLLNNKSWNDKQSQERAVLLTQYLITGKETDVFENELVFNKLLCGMKITNTVNTKFAISEIEQANCEELWNAVLKYWKKLKGTSIETLRESFFLRKGILSQKTQDKHHLKVESQTIDLLLNYLPWGISEVQLPWMEQKVFCEWTF